MQFRADLTGARLSSRADHRKCRASCGVDYAIDRHYPGLTEAWAWGRDEDVLVGHRSASPWDEDQRRPGHAA